ncbi:hypothetical protein FD05_GL002146 [Lentilactobacillus otakiensis DSM 19908 = JCM 15040]|nr:hypothetical protein FD05_GL002146 [Lentilactobacillus otakiensis DSM 19908 = JCM 15040]
MVMNLYNKAIYLGDNRLDASNRKLSKILIGLLLMLLGGIVIFFSIFALGPTPVSKGMEDIYWLIFAGGMNVIGGIGYLFIHNRSIVLTLAGVLIIVNLIPAVQQAMSGNHFLLPMIVMLIILAVAAGAISLWNESK